MSAAPHPQHAAPRSPIHGPALPVGLAVTAIGMLLSLLGAAGTAAQTTENPPTPMAVEEVPAIQVAAAVAADPCTDPGVQQALAAGDDAATVAAFGGGARFREAVVAGNAPCISLGDPARSWVVVNKTRPLDPLAFAPAQLVDLPVQITTRSGKVRPEVAAAVGAMAKAAADAGAGQIGANNGYRSHDLQIGTYAANVRTQGQTGADAASARPGYSEHQTGLALDVVSCAPGCGGIDGFGGTPQSDWVAAHSWEYGLIVRYEQVGTGVTGYQPEPWHLRYIGTELAAAYHAGGFHTLEEFFGLPAAPDYAH